MINVSREKNFASKLESAGRIINDVVNDYNSALAELNKNNTESSKNYSAEISKNIEKLKSHIIELNNISQTIKTKATEIRNAEEEEEKSYL